MALKDYNYSIEAAVRAFTKLPDAKVKKLVQTMTVSDYAALATALGFTKDEENEEEVRRLLDKYLYAESMTYSKPFSFKALFESVDNFNEVEEIEETYLNFVRSASVKQLYEADILGEIPESVQSMYSIFLPTKLRESYIAISKFENDPIKLSEYVFESDFWDLNESITFNKLRDLAIVKHLVENNILDPKIKAEISKIAGNPVGDVKSPSVVNQKSKTSDEVVGADSKTKTVVTKDKMGKVTVHNMNDPKNKDNLSLDTLKESIDSMKRLAGLK